MPSYCTTCRSQKVKEIVENNRVSYYCPDCKTKSGKALVVDGKIKIINTHRGIKHIDAAAIIVRDKKMLLLERRTYPYGLMLPAGHLEYGETIEQALQREVFEEVGLTVTSVTLADQFEQPVSYCRYGADIEEWAVFHAQCDGEGFVSNNENESIVWFPLQKVQQMSSDDFSPHTYCALVRLGYIKGKEAIHANQATT